MTATEQPTWDSRIEPVALPAPRPLLAAAPPPEVWAPPPPERAAEVAADAETEAPPELIIVNERLEFKGAATGPQVKRRIVTVAVPHDLYAGFTFDVWANPTFAVVNRLQGEDEASILLAIGQIVVATNGWCDPDGEPYPPPTEPAFWSGERAIPPDLMNLMMETAKDLLQAHRNPNSRRARRPS
jgi:hypothetical protein